MSKETSLQAKGIAILMMLFLHLFNQAEQVELCHTFLYFWNGKPLVYALSRVGALCVPIYLFLSGYGCAAVYRHRAGKMRNGKRILRLYANYWTVFLLFLPLAACVAPGAYPGTWDTFLRNAIGWQTTYNHEWWFLFPYVVLVAASPLLFGLLARLRKRGTWVLMVLLTVLYLADYAADKAFRPLYEQHYALQQAHRCVACLYSFAWGAVVFRHDLFSRFRRLVADLSPRERRLRIGGGFAALILLRMSLGPSMLNPFFAVPFLALYAACRPARGLRDFLAYMGGHSTNMWLTHTFFAYYLFHDALYSLRYPPLIFAALVGASLAASYAVRFLFAPVGRLIDRL